MRRLVAVSVLVSLGLAGLATGVLAAGGGTTGQALTRVTVAASEFKFVLSKRSVPIGTVVFTVVNKGKISHDFKIGDKKTPVLNPGQSATLRVTFTKKGRYVYLCTLQGHAAAGMKGLFAVAMTPVKTTPTTSAPATTTTVTGPATTVTVDMYEYRFELSQTTIPSGQVTFVVTNKGSEVHNFDIVGVKAGAFLSPGKTETWTVGLAPKTYSDLCDVPFHAARGMAGQLTVS